jgi:hypothetical protein
MAAVCQALETAKWDDDLVAIVFDGDALLVHAWPAMGQFFVGPGEAVFSRGQPMDATHSGYFPVG